MIWARWPNRERTWLAFLEGAAVLRVRDAETNNWLPRALRTALTHWRYQGGTRRLRSPSPHATGGAGDSRARRRWSRAVGTRGWGRTSDAGHPPGRTGHHDPERPPPPPPPIAQRRGARRPQ